MSFDSAMEIASSNLGKGNMISSAKFCLEDASSCWEDPAYKNYAKKWILKSLAYSVGVFHPDYKTVEDMDFQHFVFLKGNISDDNL